MENDTIDTAADGQTAKCSNKGIFIYLLYIDAIFDLFFKKSVLIE